MGACQGLMGNLKTMTIGKRPGKSINQARTNEGASKLRRTFYIKTLLLKRQIK
jgi:hypothetical protein